MRSVIVLALCLVSFPALADGFGVGLSSMGAAIPAGEMAAACAQMMENYARGYGPPPPEACGGSIQPAYNPWQQMSQPAQVCQSYPNGLTYCR